MYKGPFIGVGREDIMKKKSSPQDLQLLVPFRLRGRVREVVLSLHVKYIAKNI